jgi:hypothetical protein
LQAGFQYLGDDHVGIRARPDGTFVGYSIFGSARLDAGHVPRLPLQDVPAIEQPGEKLLLLVPDAMLDRMWRDAPIRAVVLPRVAGGDTRLRPAAGSQALLRLAPSSLIMPLGAGARGLRTLGALLERVPAYWLDLCDVLPSIPAHVAQVLDAVRTPCSA